ncbi:MAG: hypothetical protein N2Z72_08750 [Bacteroidales bacterium]|nr:hypothetical protein [Bacteroidales bacterium]
MKCWLYSMFLFIILLSKAQITSTQAFLQGQGGAGVADGTHPFIDANPSVSAWSENPTIIVGYFARFFMHELSDRTLTFIYPLPESLGTTSIQIFQSGFPALHMTGSKLNFAKNFGEKFSFGLNFDYYQLGTNVEYYGKKHLFILEAGSQFKVNNKLSLGTYVFNPIQPSISQVTHERLPGKIICGTTYYFSDKMLLSIDISKMINQQLSGHVGLRFTLNSRVRLTTGTSFNPFQWHMGTIFIFKKFQAIWAISYHNILSFSSGINLIYTFDRKGKKTQNGEE